MAAWKHILIITSLAVFGVSYFIVDRIMFRAAQLANNEFNPDYEPRSWVYAGSITVVYALIFFIAKRDIKKID